jgi:hypothetical protein
LIVELKEKLCNRNFPWPGKFIPIEDQSTFQCRIHILFRKLTKWFPLSNSSTDLLELTLVFMYW